MDTRERHPVISARPSSWPRVGRRRSRSTKGVHAVTVQGLHDDILALAAGPVVKLSACPHVATAGTRVTSSRTASTPPIQYP